VKLDIGAGARSGDGWFGLDINPAHAGALATAVHLPFATNTVGEIRAVDVLEHISYRDTDATLAEWRRVLVVGAPIYVQVPDAGEIMRRYCAHEIENLKTPDGLPNTLLSGAQWRLLGGHLDGVYVDKQGDWRWNAHFSLWDRDSLVVAMEAHRFITSRCETNDHPNLMYWGYAV